MDHEKACALISERMDGAPLPARVLGALDRHLETCPSCAAFARGAERLRATARFRVAAAVPDLVEPIMSAVAHERRETSPGRLRPVRPLRPMPRRRHAARLAPAVAALVIGSVAGSLAVGGPWQRSGTMRVGAAEVARGVADAAPHLDAYEAAYSIVEREPDGPVRHLTMNLWFHAPERFRLDILDRTPYPKANWTPNDLSLVVDGSRWYQAAPAPCPTAPLDCPVRRVVIRNRAPFSSQSQVPTDLVLPITTVADPTRLEVLGRGSLIGRDAVRVELPFEDAAPLFPFLKLGGTWRPFFADDRVVLWLDAESWFPLRYLVYPSTDPARGAWELRFGLTPEAADEPVFEVTARSIDEATPPPDTFAIPDVLAARDEGARETSLEDLANPIAPEELGGLRVYRVITPPDAGGPPDQALVTYSSGLSWLKLGETRDWDGSSLYGPVGVQAREIEVPGRGIAYYEPATADHGRRLSIHAAVADLYLETNLPLGDLLRAAAQLPVSGQPIPEAWSVRTSPDGATERVSLEEAQRVLTFPIEAPLRLPPGYALASVELVTVEGRTGVALYYQAANAAIGVGRIRVFLQAASALPPASSASQARVPLGETDARFTPDRHQLEWVVGNVYHSIDAPGLQLADLVSIAHSMRPVPASSGGASPSGAGP